MNLKAQFRQVLRKFGYDIVQTRHSATARRLRLFTYYQINLILDVGANEGQYAEAVWEMGYRGKIVSFEPVPEPFSVLERKTRQDANWRALPLALGDFDGPATINVASESVNSSILQPTQFFETNHEAARTLRRQEITVRRLDSLAPEVIEPGANVLLKVDTQGFERHVILGAEATLLHILGVQLEMSLTPLYEGEPGLLELLPLMSKHGFVLASIEPGYDDAESGRLYQFDALFFRERFT